MTSLMVWFAADKKRIGSFQPASVYIASDSRISWQDRYSWDCGKKLFASSMHPEIFGYCGDTLFAALVLGQIVGAIDAGYLFSNDEGVESKFEKVTQIIRTAWNSYPRKEKRDLRIVHVSRDGSEVGCKFWLKEHVYDLKRDNWIEKSPLLAPSGEVSRPLLVRGSGTSSVRESIAEWNERYSNRHTSRATFAAFCESIRSGADQYSGGPPQLVGLYRIGNGRPFGVIWQNKRYFEGLPAISFAAKSSIPWRNDSFEIVAQETKKKMRGAATHVHTLNNS